MLTYGYRITALRQVLVREPVQDQAQLLLLPVQERLPRYRSCSWAAMSRSLIVFHGFCFGTSARSSSPRATSGIMRNRTGARLRITSCVAWCTDTMAPGLLVADPSSSTSRGLTAYSTR